jgi:hypothetical protein
MHPSSIAKVIKLDEHIGWQGSARRSRSSIRLSREYASNTTRQYI